MGTYVSGGISELRGEDGGGVSGGVIGLELFDDSLCK